jgi:hypothetical protein
MTLAPGSIAGRAAIEAADHDQRRWFAAAGAHGRGDADHTPVLAETLDRSS